MGHALLFSAPFLIIPLAWYLLHYIIATSPSILNNALILTVWIFPPPFLVYFPTLISKVLRNPVLKLALQKKTAPGMETQGVEKDTKFWEKGKLK